jgi:undecaprenyl diphosphate synthase
MKGVGAQPKKIGAVGVFLWRNRFMTRPAAEPESAVVLPEDLDPKLAPRHVAVIMDGNGRWAKERGLPRAAGHRAGAESVRRTLRACEAAGVEALTLYSFSTENWKRPAEEVAALMGLLLELVRTETEGLRERNIRLRVIGRREGLPADVKRAIDHATDRTSECDGATLCLALNYGSRGEIVDAVRRIAERVRDGEIAPDSIDERVIGENLYTAGLPDPDLLIRTSGEMRVSNFLLWQISYAELYVTDVRWPDFGVETFFEALREYQKRERRFGDAREASVPSRAC